VDDRKTVIQQPGASEHVDERSAFCRISNPC
jgi:hypothetical protein